VCEPCPSGRTCDEPADCATNVCEAGTCVTPAASCGDSVENGDETAVDCGGNCPGCRSGLACDGHDDCLSATCVFGTCRDPSCSDGVQNQGETAVDCGGPCLGCDDGEACRDAGDCASASCESGLCVSCADGLRNQGEGGVDCGGPCADCALGSTCLEDDDCAGGICAFAGAEVYGVCSRSCFDRADCAGMGDFRCGDTVGGGRVCFRDDFGDDCSRDEECADKCITRGGAGCTYGCQTIADCAAGQACGLVPFGGGLLTDPDYYRVCVTIGGFCILETGCAGGACGSECTAFCDGPNQCPTGYRCSASGSRGSCVR
jgi:hypothetical protein